MNSAAHLSEQIKIDLVEAAAIAGTSTLTGDSVDMDGWDGVLFVANFGTAAADNAIHAEGSSDDGGSDAFADLAGSEVDLTSGSEEGLQVLDIRRPKERYVRPIALRGTSSTLDFILAIRYSHNTSLPTTLAVAGTLAAKQLVSPAEGTK